MNEIEAVASLINQPLPQKLTKAGSPELSELVQTRILEQANKQPYTGNTRLPYMTYDDLADSDIYDPTDFHTVGNLIRNNVAKAITERFPVVGEKYTLKIENLAYEKQKNRRLADEKAILQQEKSLMDRLRGDWVLIDNATGKEVERKSATILNVPRMTERGTFIRNGSELGLKHMFRLKPGIYARAKGDGTPSVHINPAQTTGRQMSLNMDQSTGIMSISRGTRTYGVLPLLRAAGVTDDEMKAAWGEDLFNLQKNKYVRILANDAQMAEYKKLWDEGFAPIKLDPETTMSTMGKAYSQMSPEVLLGAANKAVKLSRSMSVEDEDDRDSLAYQRIMGPADYIPERIVRDGGGLLRKMFQRVVREGSLKSIESGAFQPQVDSVFMEDKHAGYIDGASPFEGLDFASGVSRIGEGGIGDIKAAPAETRGVNDSYLGFIDPIRCFIPGTEIRVSDTRDWVKVEDLSTDDLVYSMQQLSDGSYRQSHDKISAIHNYRYSGKIYKYDDGVVSFAVTPEHRMWVTTKDSDRPRIIPCRRLFSFFRKSAYITVDKDYTEFEDCRYTKGWATTADIHEIRKEFLTIEEMDTNVYCPTVPGGLVYARLDSGSGFWVGQSPESLKVGLEVYLTYGVRKDSKGNLYANFIDKSGKTALRPMGVVAKSIVATPEYYNPSADPEEFIPAFNRGKGIEYIKRKDVDFFLANSNNMMSVGAGMIPNIGGIRSNRTLMGCLHPDTELNIIRGQKDTVHHYTAKELLTALQEGDQIIGLDKDGEPTLHTIRQVVKIEQNTQTYKVNLAGCSDENAVKVSADHKWLVKRADGSEKLITTSEIITFETDPYHCDMIQQILVDNEDIQIRWFSVGYVEEADDPGYLVDIDVDDNLYMLGNGMVTHNSKYPIQALSLKHREAPLVQRELTADGEMSTTERRVAKQLGAKFSPVDGRVIAITDDEMVIRDREGTKHTVDLYNMYPANQKGYLHNTPSVQVGDRVKANQLIAESNYTKGDSGALGTNLKVAYISGHGAEAFEDAIAISESAAKKLASEQMHKFRGDLSSDTAYDKQRFISLFGDNDYTQEQLDKIDENGMPKIGVEFKKGDPVFLGIQIRDLSTSGLSRNASVPYVKTWEHDAPGKVVDVVKGRKHMTVYTRSFTPMQLGDKLCFDEQTEIMTKRGWILFKDLLADDEVLTLNIRTGDNYFSHYESAFKYYCEKETLYRLTSKRLDIFTTASHKHVVAPMNNSRYLALQNSEQVFGKHRWFPTSCNIEHDSCFASNREDGAKERWEKYTGWVYCVTVPDTNTVFVRRNGKTVWSGNSARYGNKGTISCYDSSTYVFTDKGFKPFPELTKDDTVAVLDPAIGKAHFERPQEVQHAEYKGTMYGYQDRNLSWLVTPTHDMWAAIPSCGECKRINVTQIHGKLFGVCITPPEKLGKTVSHQLSGLANVMTNPNNFFTEEYDGTIHCCTVSTGIIYVMRDGKPMWCGNSIIPDNEMIRDENGEPYDIIQSPLGLPSRCYDDQTEFLTKDRGWQLGKDVKDTDELYCFDPKSFTGKFDKQIDTFYRKAYKGPMYGIVNGDVDFLVTPGHKMYVSHGKDFYECKVEKCFDHYCEFPVVTPSVKYRVIAAFALEWFILHNYDGYVYCPSVATGYVLTRRNGKQICLGNTNPAQLGELHLSKVAKLAGKPVSVPDFITDDTIDSYVNKQLKKYGLKSSSKIFDPRSNKYIDDVEDGYLYYYKLKHMSELKERGRGTGSYSAEEVPMKGAGAARRLGMMETSAVYSGGGMDVLKDAKLIRGQRNDEFWRKYRNGETPDIPGTPLVHKKFFSHLIASGANIERTPEGAFKLSAATDDDIKELTGNRRVEAAATFDSKNMHPIAGGLFDQTIFGDEGDRWGYYELPEPVLNPLMFKPVASILGWTDKELREYLQGARKVDNQFGPESLMKRLDDIDLESELKKAKDVLKAPRTTIQQRDLARKRIRAIYPLLKEGIKPSQLFFTRMPILPPRFRAVTVINGGDTNIAADANFLYKRMIDAADDLTAAKGNLPEEYQVDARESLYNAVNAVVGLMPTDDPKLEAKGVSGLLKWAFGKGSPKSSSIQRKVFGSNLDMGGLGTIIPNSNLTIDQVGIPEESAWSMYEPFVVRELRQNGYSMVQAMREVLDRSDEAKRELLRVMSKRPLLLNRAPTLWRYGIQGMYPVIVPGRAIQVNPNICKVYNADMDGDSIRGSVQILISSEILKNNLDKTQNSDILSAVTETKEDNMLHKEAKVGLVNLRCAISDVPRIEETQKDISETVTEWDVPEGVYTEAIDRLTGAKVVAPVTKLSLHKDVEMYDVHLATYGAYKHVVTVSKDDTLLTYEEGEVVITDASNAAGRVVPRVRALNAGGQTEYCVKYIDLGVQVPLTFDTGIFVGMLIGDGWVDNQGCTWLAAEDKSIQDWMVNFMNDPGCYIPSNHTAHLYSYTSERFGDSTAHRVWVSVPADAARKIKSKIGAGAYNKKIPMESLAASKAHRLGVLVGLISTDGTVAYSDTPAKGKKSTQKSIVFHTTSQDLRDNIIDLCLSLGVRATATEYMGVNSKVPCYGINLSVRDMAKLYRSEPKFRLIAEHDETNMKRIADAVECESEDSYDSYDIVPYPVHLSALVGQVTQGWMNAASRSGYKKQGYISRDLAKKIVAKIKEFDFSTYTESNSGPKAERKGYTPEQAEEQARKWIELVENEEVCWEVVTDVKYLGKMDGWDVTVPGPLTFALGCGTFVQDSMTTHVPVSQTAIEAIDKNMLPSRNLLSPQNFKAHFIPRDASNEGLFLASRVAPGKPVRFRTEAEAQAAYDRGEIKIDTPIEIG